MLGFKKSWKKISRPVPGQSVTFTLSGNVIKDQFGRVAKKLLTRSGEEYRLIQSPYERPRELLCLLPHHFFQDEFGPHLTGIIYSEADLTIGKELNTGPIMFVQMKNGWMRRGELVSITGMDPSDKFWKLKGILLG